MQITAKKRRGKCLSSQYENNETRLLWECSEGHQWWAKPGNIRAGKWCPECAGNVRSSIERYHTLAKEHGGKCLSTKYTNAHTKLLWECSESLSGGQPRIKSNKVDGALNAGEMSYRLYQHDSEKMQFSFSKFRLGSCITV